MTRVRSPSRRDIVMALASVGAGVEIGPLRADAQTQALPAPAVPRGTTLTISTWGGITEDCVRKYMQSEFERTTGAKLAFDIGGQGARFTKLLAQRATPPADLFFSTDEAVIAGHRRGVLLPTTRKNVPNFTDLYDWAMTLKNDSDSTVLGVPYALLGMVISFNPQLVKTAPTSWLDLWRPEFKGHLVMPSPQTSLMPEWVTITNELSGGTSSDLTPGLKKLSELRPIKASMFWTDWAPLSKTGEALIAPEFDYYIEAMKAQGYPVDYIFPKEKGIAAPEYISIVKGAANPALAEYFLDLALSPKVQEAFAIEAFQGPTNKKVVLTGHSASKCAYGPKVTQLRFFDAAPFVDARPSMTERFNTEVLPNWQLS